jgi:tRNA/tmRNA/rRNA uracil-C5-methylase (TrmA/RlmC/RlmD family)
MFQAQQCPVLDRCGGCPQWSAPEPDRRAHLTSRVEQVVRRRPDSVVLSDSPVGWRHRLTLRPDDHGRLGLSAPRSHTVVALPGCPVAHPKLEAALQSLPPLPGPAEVELRTDGTRVVCVIRSRAPHGKKRRGRAPSREALREIPEATVDGVVIDGHNWRGKSTLALPVAGDTLRASAGSFFQVNLAMNDQLIAWLRARLEVLRPEHLLDLYSGIGNLSLALADTAGGLTLIESARSAVEDARHNARTRNLTADIRKGDAHRFQAGDAFFDVALLDPPRLGAPKVLPQLAITRPRAIVYVACDPHALARDAAALAKASDYRIAELAAFEMFPWSDHLETVAVFTPGGAHIA